MQQVCLFVFPPQLTYFKKEKLHIENSKNVGKYQQNKVEKDRRAIP